jgi:hypothetical protein
VSLKELSNFIKHELKQDPQKVMEQAFKEGILAPSPRPGRAVIV